MSSVSPLWATLRGLSLEQYLPHREDLEEAAPGGPKRFNRDAAAAGQPASAVAAAVAATIRLAEIRTGPTAVHVAPLGGCAHRDRAGRSAPRALKILAGDQGRDQWLPGLGDSRGRPRSYRTPYVATAVFDGNQGLDGEHPEKSGARPRWVWPASSSPPWARAGRGRPRGE